MTATMVSSPISRTGASGTLQVLRRDDAADDVVVLTLGDPDGRRLPPWTPGNHIELLLPNGLTRHYSLCGDRWDGLTYQIAVLRTRESRGGSAWIHDHLHAGTSVPFGGPRNQFPMVPADEYRFVAGGIGITPLRPMIEQAIRTGRPWRLLYGGRSRASMVFHDELATYVDHVDVVPEDEAGRPDVATWLGAPIPRVAVYCCGPDGLLTACRAACASWPPHTLRTERFVAAERSQGGDRPFTLRLRSAGSVVVQPGQSTLDALRSLGGDTLSSCRQGVCGTCEVRVLDGVPDHRDSVLTDADRAAGDCMLVCVSRSLTDTLTLDL